MITSLSIDCLRNLSQLKLSIANQINLITGDNGAGKTSLLESIHILGTGRSFRSNQIPVVIQDNKNALTVFAELSSGSKIGVERTRQGDFRVRLNGETQDKLSTLALHLPIRVMTPESFLMLTTGSQPRRQFLDFSVFHVEHCFASDWQTYQRLLKQRNALLKTVNTYDQVYYWDKQIIPLIQRINQTRQAVFNEIITHFDFYQSTFLPQYEVQYAFKSGVDSHDISAQLKDSFEQDRRYGHTTIGPHKADLSVKLDKTDAYQVLSRGELKMLVASMILGQVRWLLEKKDFCCLLVDDLCSELDRHRQQQVIDQIQSLVGAQAFITAINRPDFLDKHNKLISMFHVEHGKLVE